MLTCWRRLLGTGCYVFGHRERVRRRSAETTRPAPLRTVGSLRAVGLAIAAVAGAVGVGGLGSAAEASTVGARTSAPPPPLPGYTTVITSVTVGSGGGTIGPVGCNGGSFTLAVPAGAFSTDVQITLTCGDLDVLAPQAFPGFELFDALGVTVELNGETLPGTFPKPLTLTDANAFITPSSVMGIWNGTAFLNYTDVTLGSGVAHVSFDRDSDFGFMSVTYSGCSRRGCTRPAITGVAQSARVWRAGSALPRYARLPHHARAGFPVGTTFSFSLNEPAQVRYAFTRTVRGRIVTVATLIHHGQTGKNSLFFAARINRAQTLAPSTYTLRITATKGKLRSNTASLRFTILPPRPRSSA
jgi:hypothetical protein